MAKTLPEILAEWELSHTLPVLKSFGVTDVESLLYLIDSDLDVLFREDFSTKIKFRYKLRLFGREKEIDELKTILLRIEDLLQDILLAGQSLPNFNKSAPSQTDYNLDKFLSNKAQCLLDHFVLPSSPTILTQRGRTVIIDNAIEFYTTRKQVMTEREFLSVANQICAQFPGESLDIYYNKNGKYPSGKLYSTYKNTAARLRKEGIFPFKNKRNPEALQSLLPVVTSSDTAHDEDKEWLKFFCEPWEEVQRRWTKTVEPRRAFLKSSKSLLEIFTEWPAYKKEFGKTLIDIDFNAIGIGNSYGLLSKWDDFYAVFVQKAPELIKDKRSAEVLSKLNTIQNKDLRDAAVFDLLSALLPPMFTVRDKNKTSWKSSIADSQSLFLLRVQTANDLQTQLDRLSKQFKDFGLQLQPLIALISAENPSQLQIIGIFDDIKYTYSSVLEAVTNIFKLHYIFNLQFQKHCHYIWEFLQSFFFEVDTKSISPRVGIMLSEFS